MTLSFSGLRSDQGEAVFYNPNFRAIIEDHRLILRDDIGADTRIIPNGDALRWRYDYYGLLTSLDIPRYLHWITLRVNGLLSPTDYVESMTVITIPNNNSIQQLVSKFRTLTSE